MRSPTAPATSPPPPVESEQQADGKIDGSRYADIGTAICVGAELLLSSRKTPWSVADSALDGATLGTMFARFRKKRGSQATFGDWLREGLRNLAKLAPFILWGLLMVGLAIASLERTSGQGDMMNALWLVVLVPLGIVALWVFRAIDVMCRVSYIRGDYEGSGDARKRLITLLGIALVIQLLMFVVWPANALLNLVAVLATAAVMGFYYVMRDLFRERAADA